MADGVNTDTNTGFLVEKDGERQCVQSLEGYEDWTILVEGADAMPKDQMVFTGERWEFPLGVLKADALNAGKDLMKFIRNLGLSTTWGVFDSDEKSQNSLFGCLAVAQSQENFSVEWTLQNNSVVVLDMAALKSVCVLLQAFESSLHQRMKVLSQKVKEATTSEELNLIKF